MDWLAGWLVVITEYPSIHIRMFMVFFYSLVICLFACLVILFKNEMKNSLKKNSFFFNENDDNDDNVKCFLSDEISLNMGKQAFPFSFCYGRSFWVFFVHHFPSHPSIFSFFVWWSLCVCVCVSYPSLWILFSKKNKINFFFFLKKVEKTATKSNQKIFYLLL